jgi:rod shape-determining protein MreC
MPVVNGGGLVGTISRVFPNSSVVLLIIDPEFGIAAKVLTESEPSRAATLPSGRPPEAGFEVVPGTTTTTSTTIADSADTTTTANPDVDPLAPVAEPTTTSPPLAEPGTETTTIEVVRETGPLQGQGADKPLLLRLVGDVAVGSAVQTAGGTESVAPPGIPIGTVSAVSAQSGSSSPVVEVESSAGDLTKLSFVRVLLYLPNLSGS